MILWGFGAGMAKSDTGRKRVTLTDVARAAGVSKSTVSLVLNDSSLIKKETQQKVQQAIEQLGYVYNRFAANLRSQKSLTIGVVIPPSVVTGKNRCLIPCWNTTSRALSSVQ